MLQFCWVVSGECLRIIENCSRSLLRALHASKNQICDRELSPVVGTLRVQEGQGTIVCVSGVATSARSATPKMFTSPLTSFTRKDIVSPDGINQKASPRKRREYVNVLADCVFVYVTDRRG